MPLWRSDEYISPYLPSRAKSLPSFKEVGTVVIDAYLEVVYRQIDTKNGYRHNSM